MLNGKSAVAGYDLPRDKLCLVRREEKHKLCYLRWLSDSAERSIIAKRVDIRCRKTGVHLRFDDSGANAIYCYSRRAKLLCKRLCHTVKSRLCGRVMHLA